MCIRDSEITYLTYLVDLFDKLGGKKYTVFKYILAHKSAENTLIITTRELEMCIRDRGKARKPLMDRRFCRFCLF